MCEPRWIRLNTDDGALAVRADVVVGIAEAPIEDGDYTLIYLNTGSEPFKVFDSFTAVLCLITNNSIETVYEKTEGISR